MVDEQQKAIAKTIDHFQTASLARPARKLGKRPMKGS